MTRSLSATLWTMLWWIQAGACSGESPSGDTGLGGKSSSSSITSTSRATSVTSVTATSSAPSTAQSSASTGGLGTYIDAVCGFAERCTAEQGRGYESLAACKTHWTQLSECRGGLVQIPAATLAECTSYLEALACDKSLNLPGSPCAAVFQGGPVSATQEHCYADRFAQHLCDFGNYCPDPAPATCSKCVAQFAVGADCTSHIECDTGHCQNSKCQPPVAPGQPCTPTAPCFGFHICTAGMCAALKAEGETCVVDSECYVGAFCLVGKCTRLPACQRTEDQRCNSSQDCGADFYCQGPSFTCQPRVPVNGDCTQGLEACVQTAYCDTSVANTCKPLPAEGGMCGASGICPVKTFCSASNVCEAQRPDGSDCNAPEQCQTGACSASKCGCG